MSDHQEDKTMAQKAKEGIQNLAEKAKDKLTDAKDAFTGPKPEGHFKDEAHALETDTPIFSDARAIGHALNPQRA
uniref:Antitoxin n=1 Tax=Panagrolaimus sp. JU765 TaxID=591449 RepID=A0AC34RCE9_9BILA